MIIFAHLCPQMSTGPGCSMAEHKNQTKFLESPWSGDGSAQICGRYSQGGLISALVASLSLPSTPRFSLAAHQSQAATGAAGKCWDFLRLQQRTRRIPTGMRSRESVGQEELWGLAAPPQHPDVRSPEPKHPKGSPLFYPKPLRDPLSFTPNTPRDVLPLSFTPQELLQVCP